MMKNNGVKRKYRNEKAIYQDIVFDSMKEMKRYIVLADAQKRGEITDLELQPQYELIPAVKDVVIEHKKTKDKPKEIVLQRAITYKADFRYRLPDGKIVVEDVKASPDLLTDVYKMKEKMLFFYHRIRIRKVYNATEKI